MLTFSTGAEELRAGLFTWILNQRLNEILSLSFPMEGPPTAPQLKAEVDYSDHLGQSLHSSDEGTEAQGDLP